MSSIPGTSPRGHTPVGGGGVSHQDDAAFTPGTDLVTPTGAMFDDVAPDSVDEGDVGIPRMAANRVLYVTIRDAAGNERGVNVDANNDLGISQATHDNLNANANIQIGDADVDNGNPVPISDAGGTLSVDGAVTVTPPGGMIEGGLTEMIGVDEQVDQNEYSASVGVALGDVYSGEILSIALYSTESGTGTVQVPEGIVYILDADPNVAAGDTAFTAGEWVTILGKIRVLAADWDADANGALAYIYDNPVPFHSLSTLYFVWRQTDAASWNDAAGDDEQLRFNFWFRRDS